VSTDEYLDLDLEEKLHDAAVAANGGRVVGSNDHGLLGALRTGDWLQAQSFPPLRYAVPGLVPQGLTLNIGAPKIGKSWLVLDFALAIAAGGRALGHIAMGNPRPVLLLALEDGDRRLQDRCWKLLEGGPIPDGFHYMVKTEPGKVLETVEQWLSMYDGDDATVIIDTLGKVMPPALNGESSYMRDYRIGGALKLLADDHPGSAVVVNHHDRKAGSDDFVDSVSGTHGLAGSADTVLVVSRNRQETGGTVKVTGRDVPENEYALTLLSGMFWTLTGGDLATASVRAVEMRSQAGLGDRSLEVLAYVNAHPNGVTVKEVDDELGITDARTYLGRLNDKERICRLRRGVYAPTQTPVATVASVANAEANALPLQHSNTCDTPLGGDDV
jgi:RecA-family ATPase